jgi:hypothetical protein
MRAERRAMDSEWWLYGRLDLGDQAACCRIRSGEFNAGRLADHAAPTVTADQVTRPQGGAVGQFDVHAGAVLRETRHLASAADRH